MEWRVHFDPRWTLRQEASNSLTADLEKSRLNIIFLNRHSDEVFILNGQIDPIGGWYSRYCGSKVAAPTVTGRMKVQLPSGVLTAVKSSAGALSVPQDVPWALLPPDMLDLLRCNRFSAFAGSRS